MPGSRPRLIVFVHGWSVTNTDTYGGLPERLVAESRAAGFPLAVRQIFLGRYISFHDAVRIEDISRALEDAVQRELAEDVEAFGRFACITHSTGGPVARDWWWRHYGSTGRAGRCPMSHLVMLAPANFGSALAQLGKGRISRLKSWFAGVEPGQGVLDWLELGSRGAWQLNEAWIDGDESVIGPRGLFPFVITGQTIDRRFYDNLNSYTGETGSDGVVRVAAANLNATRIRLRQGPAARVRGAIVAPELELAGSRAITHAPRTAMRVVAGKSHSGEKMGIMRSVSPDTGRAADAETVGAILDCLGVSTAAEYRELCDGFDRETERVQASERTEVESRLLLGDRVFVHDRCAMAIFRVRDELGHPVEDFDLLLTAGPESDPNHLPSGFAIDRQANRISRGTITYYFNADVMHGCDAVVHDGRVVRPESPGAGSLGLRIRPRPTDGFVHYAPCEIAASSRLLKNVVRPNETTLVDITLRRIVRGGVFELDRGFTRRDFRKTEPGGVIGSE